MDEFSVDYKFTIVREKCEKFPFVHRVRTRSPAMVTHGVTLLLRPDFVEMGGDEFPSAGLAHVRAICHHLVQVIESGLLRHDHRTHAKHILTFGERIGKRQSGGIPRRIGEFHTRA